jgi:hypothetical protein
MISRIYLLQRKIIIFAPLVKFVENARVAELVDALVSNTSDSNIVPVRSRPRVHKINEAL